MKVYQKKINDVTDLEHFNPEFEPTIFFLFMSSTYKERDAFLKALAKKFPHVLVFGCSAGGEIVNNQVFDNIVALTAVLFEKTTLALKKISLKDYDSYHAGTELYAQLENEKEDLKHILVLSDGLNITGSELVRGLSENKSKNVSITGGLAADQYQFKETFLIYDNQITSNCVIAVGLYSKDLKIGYGSEAGWDLFGMERIVTKSKDNTLYELDGKPALEVYRYFLGDKAADLPASGLHFPLGMRNENGKLPIIRSVFDINEEEQSITVAGNIEEGSSIHLMKANIDRLIDAAEKSAITSKQILETNSQLTFLISCVGRKVVLKQLVEEEVEAAVNILGEKANATGFYSYGEIAPFNEHSTCELHNQTMTITTFSE